MLATFLPISNELQMRIRKKTFTQSKGNVWLGFTIFLRNMKAPKATTAAAMSRRDTMQTIPLGGGEPAESEAITFIK